MLLRLQTSASHKGPAPGRCIAALIALLCLWASPTGARAQEPPEERGSSSVQSFEDVRVKRISPHQLSEIAPGLGRSDIATAGNADLPRPLNRQELERLREIAASRTTQIMALIMPPRPYRQVPMVYIGHALWVEPARGEAPLLISSADWLRDAQQIFLIDQATAALLREHGVALATEPAPGAARPSSRGITNLLKHDADKLIELRTGHQEPNLNLASLSFIDPQDAARQTPSAGWTLHATSRPSPPMIFAYSPERPGVVEPVQIHDLRTLEEAYQFYLPNTSTAILGAPLFSNTGNLVGLNALRHPERGEVGLAVPPGALKLFVDSLSGD